MTRFLTTLSLYAALLLSAAGASAQPVLTVTVDPDDASRATEYTADELLALESVEVTTDNDYLEDGPATFTGPLLRTLLADADLEPGDEIQVAALNDYRTSIPAEDVLDYDVIVAVLMDGEPMSVRDKGPFWVIYPMSDNPELQEPKFNDRLIWQLSKVELTQPE